MGIMEWAERRTRALSVWDVGLLKICCVLFGIVVGAHMAHFVFHNIWWFAAALVLLGGWVTYRWLSAEAP